MQSTDLNIRQADVYKLLCTASGDAALLYLYLQSGNAMEQAAQALSLNASRIQCAAASLRQLGLWQERERKPVMVGERPQYTEQDVIKALDQDISFQNLYREVEQILGKGLTTEEIKILLGFVRYLAMDPEVVVLLITHCKEKAQWKGKTRTPSLRSIEKDAYHWSEWGIDTMEEAIAYIQKQQQCHTRLGRLMEQLQIRGRNLTPGEEKYARQWLDWGFDEKAVEMAYERTCLNTGGLSWAYMNKILQRWKEANLLTGEQIQTGDTKPGAVKASGQLGDAEWEAIQKMLQEG